MIEIHHNLYHYAQENLTNQGFRSFFPTIVIYHTPAVQTQEPLFKGYGFVYFDPKTTPNWRAINSTKGIVSLVPKTAVIPTPIPRGFVEFLIDHDPITEYQFDQSLSTYYPGLRVTMKDPDHYLSQTPLYVHYERGKYLEILIRGDCNPNSSILIAKDSVVPE